LPLNYYWFCILFHSTICSSKGSCCHWSSSYCRTETGIHRLIGWDWGIHFGLWGQWRRQDASWGCPMGV